MFLTDQEKKLVEDFRLVPPDDRDSVELFLKRKADKHRPGLRLVSSSSDVRSNVYLGLQKLNG